MRVLRLRRPCVCLSLTPGPVSNAVNVGLLTASPPPHSLENNKQPSAPSPCRICTARSQSVGQDLSACRRKFNPRGFVPSRASPNSPRDFISQFPPLSSSSSSSSSSSQNEAQKQKSMFLLPCPILLSRCHCKHSRNSSDITISALFSRPPPLPSHSLTLQECNEGGELRSVASSASAAAAATTHTSPFHFLF